MVLTIEVVEKVSQPGYLWSEAGNYFVVNLVEASLCCRERS
jgi:hypothetical protein